MNIGLLLNLYGKDASFADQFLIPQRWCNHQWGQLNSSLNPYSDPLYQLAKRAAKVAMLVLPTLVAYSIGVIGILIKASLRAVSHPCPVRPIPSFLEIVDPSPQVLLPTLTDLAPLLDRTTCPITQMPQDLLIYTAQFLTAREKMTIMKVSKFFHSIGQSPILWNDYLSHPDYRIWGAMTWKFVHKKNGYHFIGNSRLPYHPLDQIKTYYTLNKKGLAGTQTNEFFDYLARLMPGGPIAFSRLPCLDQTNPSTLQPNQLSQSIIRGTTENGYLFLALRVIDRAQQNCAPCLLIFIRDELTLRWEQQENAYWSQNELNIHNTHVLNYLLSIIASDQSMLTYRQFPGYRPMVKLAYNLFNSHFSLESPGSKN